MCGGGRARNRPGSLVGARVCGAPRGRVARCSAIRRGCDGSLLRCGCGAGAARRVARSSRRGWARRRRGRSVWRSGRRRRRSGATIRRRCAGGVDGRGAVQRSGRWAGGGRSRAVAGRLAGRRRGIVSPPRWPVVVAGVATPRRAHVDPPCRRDLAGLVVVGLGQRVARRDRPIGRRARSRRACPGARHRGGRRPRPVRRRHPPVSRRRAVAPHGRVGTERRVRPVGGVAAGGPSHARLALARDRRGAGLVHARRSRRAVGAARRVDGAGRSDGHLARARRVRGFVWSLLQWSAWCWSIL